MSFENLNEYLSEGAKNSKALRRAKENQLNDYLNGKIVSLSLNAARRTLR